MPRRETRRRRMSGQVSEPDRDRLADQQAQGPPALRQVADPGDQLVVHAGVHELLQPPVGAKHAERRVPGAEQVSGRPHELPQHQRQAQLPGHQGIRAQQPAQPLLGGQHVISAVHRLHQQLIQFQPRRVRETQPASRVRRGRAARPLRSGRHRTGLTCRGGHPYSRVLGGTGQPRPHRPGRDPGRQRRPASRPPCWPGDRGSAARRARAVPVSRPPGHLHRWMIRASLTHRGPIGRGWP